MKKSDKTYILRKIYIIHFCSCGEQIRHVRHKRYLTSIRNLLIRLSSGWHMLFVGVSAWTGLDPRGVTCGEDSNAQVSKELSESQISWL